MRQNIGSALTIVGAVVGAGFASGREVYQFFTRYGANGVLGAALATIILVGLSLRVAVLTKYYRAPTFAKLVEMHLGDRESALLKVVLSLVLWLGLGVMLSGAGAAGKALGAGRTSTIALTSALVALCLYGGVTGVMKANALLMPVLLALSAYLFIKGVLVGNNFFLMCSQELHSPFSAAWSALLYAGLNSLLLFVVIPPLVHGGNVVGVVMGCFVFGFLLLLSTLLLSFFPVLAAESPVPMLSIARVVAAEVPSLYGLILWTALTTTALANGWGLVSSAERWLRMGRMGRAVFVVSSAMPIACLPFAELVAVAYTGLGYVSLVVITAVALPRR